MREQYLDKKELETLLSMTKAELDRIMECLDPDVDTYPSIMDELEGIENKLNNEISDIETEEAVNLAPVNEER